MAIILNRRSLSTNVDKISAENGKKGTFLSLFIDHSISPYINVELQVFHLTLTLNIDGGGGGVIAAIITNSRHYFCPRL